MSILTTNLKGWLVRLACRRLKAFKVYISVIFINNSVNTSTLFRHANSYANIVADRTETLREYLNNISRRTASGLAINPIPIKTVGSS